MRSASIKNTHNSRLSVHHQNIDDLEENKSES